MSRAELCAHIARDISGRKPETRIRVPKLRRNLILKDVELERLNDTAARALIARRPVVHVCAAKAGWT